MRSLATSKSGCFRAFSSRKRAMHRQNANFMHALLKSCWEMWGTFFYAKTQKKKNAPEIVQSLLVFLQPRVMGRSTANNGKQRWPRCHFNSKAIEESTKTWQFYDILKCNIAFKGHKETDEAIQKYPKCITMTIWKGGRHLETLAFTLSHCFIDVGSIFSLISSSCEKRGVFLVFILCKILPRYQERSTDLSKFMSDLCHVRCGSLKEDLPGREEMLRNEFNRSKCWMLNVTNITKHKLFTNDSWSIAAIGRGRHGFRCIIAREDPLTRFDWHLTQIQRFSTRLTIFEPRSPERTPNKRNKHLKKHGMTTSREDIDGVALNIVESQPVLRIEVGEERLKKVTTEKLTPHCLEQP